MRKFLLCACMAIVCLSAAAQAEDCKTITDPTAPAAATAAPAEETPLLRIVKSEPPVGQLPSGTAILVDDHSCPAGKIKKVVGGDVTIGGQAPGRI